MLNQRQLEILLSLCENTGRFMTASQFSKEQSVSLRTVQNDLKAIRQFALEQAGIEFESAVPKGSRIRITDPDAFARLRDDLLRQFSNTATNVQSERVSEIVRLLMKQHRAVSMYDVETSVFVSRSTLFGDLKKVEDLLSRYELELMRGANKLFIDGTEINKRRCLSEEKLMVDMAGDPSSERENAESMRKIKEILVRTFIEFKRTISEVSLGNAILHLFVALRRMEDWFFIEESELERDTESFDTSGSAGDPELEIASAIMKGIGREFHLRIPETETRHFALYMKGKGNYTDESVISPQINELVLNGLREIRNHCDIDLTDDVNLRIALGLHLTPLVVRIRHNMQLDNNLVDYIRKTYPQGYDMATYFAAYLQTALGKKVKDEEIAFLAIHLYKALTDLQNAIGTRKMLVISSLRRSENILLRQTLYQWFRDQLAELWFTAPEDLTEQMLDHYDTFVTTEKGKFYDMGLAVYISPFPGKQDYLNLKLALDGFENASDMLGIFDPALFRLYEPSKGREAILKDLCALCSAHYDLEGLYDAVIRREEMGSTYLGSKVAAAHPHAPVSPDTLIGVGFLSEAIDWDEDKNKVQLIFLVHIGKNNPKAYQIWNYLSRIIANEKLTDKLAADPTYKNFLHLAETAIAEQDVVG